MTVRTGSLDPKSRLRACRNPGVVPVDLTGKGGTMARYILKDEKYVKKPVVFESYREMIDKVRSICSKEKKTFAEKDEKSLKYDVEKMLD